MDSFSQEDFMRLVDKPLYKYLKRKYAIKTVDEGHFRIGTLYEYQNEEKHGSVIGDAEEGKVYSQTAPSENFIFSPGSTVPDFARDFFPGADENSHLFINRVQLRKTYNAPNCYLYCVTAEMSEDTMNEFGCDTVLEIADWIGFFKKINLSLARQVEIKDGFYVLPCIYAERAVHYSRERHKNPIQIKSKEYSYQKEIRAAWFPLEDRKIEPVVVCSMEASEHCRIIRF